MDDPDIKRQLQVEMLKLVKCPVETYESVEEELYGSSAKTAISMVSDTDEDDAHEDEEMPFGDEEQEQEEPAAANWMPDEERSDEEPVNPMAKQVMTRHNPNSNNPNPNPNPNSNLFT